MVNQCGCISTFQDAGILRQIDLTLVPKIGTYVKECVTETREMKQLLKDIIKPETLNGAYIPDPNNKPFFTRTSAICSHITNAKWKPCHVMINQNVRGRKSNNGNCQINPVTYFLFQTFLFTTMNLLKKVPKMIVILRNTMILD